MPSTAVTVTSESVDESNCILMTEGSCPACSTMDCRPTQVMRTSSEESQRMLNSPSKFVRVLFSSEI